MGTVLFTSIRTLERAENIKAVWDAYDGDKEFCRSCDMGGLDLDKYDLQVADDFPRGRTVKKFIMIAHGMGAGKTYGLNQPHPYYSNPDAITYITVSSKAIIPTAMSYSGLPESKILPLGMPRTDVYFKLKKEKLPYRMHLYAPTFRGWKWWKPDWDEISRHLPQGDKFVAKPHMVTGEFGISRLRNIETVSPSEISTPYLVNCDTLITDYSSIMFDALVLRKPVILFAKDKKRYLDTRGMYRKYPEEYSKYFFNTEKEMVECLRYAKWTDFDEELREYQCGACDGHSTKRIIDLIKSEL